MRGRQYSTVSDEVQHHGSVCIVSRYTVRARHKNFGLFYFMATVLVTHGVMAKRKLWPANYEIDI